MPHRRTWGETLRRAAAMSPNEAATRLAYFVRQRQDGLRITLGLAPPAEQELPESPAHPEFFFRSDDIPAITTELQARLPQQAGRILAQAEKIVQHRFDLLGYQDLDFADLDLGRKIDWHLDPVSGRRALGVPWHRVPYLDYDAAGDHKVVWELNRHQHLVTLAKAWWLRRDDRFLRTLSSLWYDWRAENPYGVGINWASSLEVAFRSLSWLWVLHLLPRSEAAPESFRRDVVTELGRAARHIERYLSTYFAPNTHLLGEAVALYFVGTLCPRFASARRWRELGWRIVVEQAAKQVRADGLHFEQSTYYHVYALDFFLHARLLASRNRQPGGAGESPLDETIERMASALETVAQGGAAPRFGDDDGGRLFDGSRNRTEHLNDPLATCAALFGRADFKAACPQMPEETLWLLGVEGARKFAALTAAAPRPRSRWFEPSGLALIASSDPVLHALAVDAGPQGFGNAGHGHADALSLQLIVEGRHALSDPGTCCYPVEREERNLFRGTAAHNTLAVDGLDQAEPRGSFAWRRLPNVRVERWAEGRGGGLLIASHDGYERLAEPVTHRRWVVWLGGGVYVIRDVAVGEGTHRLRLSWRLGPEFRVLGMEKLGKENRTAAVSAEAGDAVNEARPPDPRGEGHGGVRFEAPSGVVVGCIPAGRAAGLYKVAQGDWSSAYGVKSQAPVVYCDDQTTLPAEFVSAITVSPVAGGAARLEELVGTEAPDVCAYEFADENRRVLMLFSDAEGSWRWRGWSSDARFLAMETDASGRQGRRVFFCGGSFLECAGKRLVQCRREVDCWEWLRGAAEEHIYCSEPEAVEHAETGPLARLAPRNVEPA